MRGPWFKDLFTLFAALFTLFFLFPPALPTRAAPQKPETAKNAPAKTAAAKKPPIPAEPRSIEEVFVPAGTVTLGSGRAEKAYAYSIGGPWARKWRWFDGEKRRRVFVRAFYIDRYPVTQAQYEKFVRAEGRRAPYISREDYQRQGFLVHPYEEVIPYLWHETEDGPAPPPDRLGHPVVLVSVDDAGAYCRWRGRFAPGRAFALPTEDQWEKASRGTDGRYFPWGSKWDPSRANIGATGPGGTTPVDRYPAGRSPYGAYEMAGNIFEWTRTPAKDDPERYILKSCSWDDLPGLCRGAARHSRPGTSRHILIGFRCVSTPKKK